MNAEALLGTVLGTCSLERLIGQGGMGAVYLAQQTRPRRRVAVKVLMPMASLTPVQLAAFLERFRRETDAAASLEHPNIMPVHEYGERDSLAYLVMPYISGGTLRDEMEREGQLPLTQVVKYLDQLAAALDFAHRHGVIHRDIKPANILITPEGRLLLTDFGLVKIITEGQPPQIRLTGEGAPVGTPDYMSPEQVIGEDVDGRSDLYSLGVILFQMVTGTTPFQGETPMQIAAQQLRSKPPSPRALRPDLPVQVEQVILRSMAKKPDGRYPTGRAFTKAFRAALDETGIPLDTGAQAALNGATAARLLVPTGQFEIVKPSGMLPTIKSGRGGNGLLSGQTNTSPSPSVTTSTSLPAAKIDRAGGLLSKTGKFPRMDSSQRKQGYVSPQTAKAAEDMSDMPSMRVLPRIQTTTREAPSTGNVSVPTVPQLDFSDASQMSPVIHTTGSMPVPGRRNTMKLANSLKVVQMEVMGQPGKYVTGLLPTIPTTPSDSLTVDSALKKPTRRVLLLGTLLAIALLLFGTIGSIWFVRSHGAATKSHGTVMNAGAPNPQGTAFAQATATARANIILDDPLSVNTNNWLTSPPDVYAFKGGAYHITDHGNKGRATVLQSSPFTGPLGYTLTLQEVNGNDTTPNNSFGMIMRFSQQNKAGKSITTFYSFEVVNNKGGEYQFWKYDDGTTAASPWTEIWHQPFGSEFHEGHGVQSVNTFKIFMNGSMFTFIVNGKLIKTAQDRSLQSGTVGMLVNLDGTEIAFKDLLLTRN